MRRYTITLGSPTTSGGRVISASADGKIDNVAIALEGDLATCPVCETAGKILCVGPRIPEIWNGKNVALENDLCLCRCVPSPRLMPAQNFRCQVIKDTGHALSHPLTATVPARGAPDQVYSERFMLVDDEEGYPLARREYAVVRASGKLEFGTSDVHGHTHMLSATARSECVEIYAQGPLVAATLISPSGTVLHHRGRRRTTLANEATIKEVRVQRRTSAPIQAPLKLSSAAPYELSTMHSHLPASSRLKT